MSALIPMVVEETAQAWQCHLSLLGSGRAGLRGTRRLPRRDVADDGGRTLVQERLDEFHELVRVLKACIRIEAGDFEEFPVALHGPIYPPRPHLLTSSPASDLDSGHAFVLSVR